MSDLWGKLDDDAVGATHAVSTCIPRFLHRNLVRDDYDRAVKLSEVWPVDQRPCLSSPSTKPVAMGILIPPIKSATPDQKIKIEVDLTGVAGELTSTAHQIDISLDIPSVPVTYSVEANFAGGKDTLTASIVVPASYLTEGRIVEVLFQSHRDSVISASIAFNSSAGSRLVVCSTLSWPFGSTPPDPIKIHTELETYTSGIYYAGRYEEEVSANKYQVSIDRPWGGNNYAGKSGYMYQLTYFTLYGYSVTIASLHGADTEAQLGSTPGDYVQGYTLQNLSKGFDDLYRTRTRYYGPGIIARATGPYLRILYCKLRTLHAGLEKEWHTPSRELVDISVTRNQGSWGLEIFFAVANTSIPAFEADDGAAETIGFLVELDGTLLTTHPIVRHTVSGKLQMNYSGEDPEFWGQADAFVPGSSRNVAIFSVAFEWPDYSIGEKRLKIIGPTTAQSSGTWSSNNTWDVPNVLMGIVIKEVSE